MRVLTFLCLALLLVACSQPAASPSISTDQARAIALREAAGSNVEVVSAEISTYGAKSNGGSAADPKTVVWAVRLSGNFPSVSCGGYTATPQPCPSANSELILINATTGEFIQGEAPAP
jgi:hypothetical protein